MIQPVGEKIILGIDPGTTIMGYGVLRVAGTKPEMIAMGIIDLRKYANHYLKLRHIHERVLSIIESYLPDELAIEAPFYGKNVQSMLKLGRCLEPRHSHHGVCPIEDKNGHYRQWAGVQRAGGRYVATYAPFQQGRYAYFHGCHGRSGGRLLPFPANGSPCRREGIQRLERLHRQASGQGKALSVFSSSAGVLPVA